MRDNFYKKIMTLAGGDVSAAVAAYLVAHPVTAAPDSNKVDKVTGKSLVSDTEIAKIHASGSDNQDLSGLQPKETGKGLYPDVDASKLAGIEAGANNYTHPANHSPSIITQDSSNRFVTDTEKSTWNGKSSLVLGTTAGTAYDGANGDTAYTHSQAAHAPSTAQKNSDITKAEIEAKLTGSITSHTHAYKSGIVTRDISASNATVNVAHGLGRTPVGVRVTGFLIQTANTTHCVGSYDGTNHNGLCTIMVEGTTTATTDTTYSSTSFELGFSAATVVNPYTGANRQNAVITFDGTNVIFTWTKTGTVAAATANILWEAF